MILNSTHREKNICYSWTFTDWQISKNCIANDSQCKQQWNVNKNAKSSLHLLIFSNLRNKVELAEACVKMFALRFMPSADEE